LGKGKGEKGKGKVELIHLEALKYNSIGRFTTHFYKILMKSLENN